MSIASRYHKDIEFGEYIKAQLDSLNARYESVLRDCSEIEQQEKEMKARINKSNPNITNISCLLAETALSELAERNLWRKVSTYSSG